MRKRLLCPLVLAMLLTGCASEPLADRTYTQALALSGERMLTMRGFEAQTPLTVSGENTAEALRRAEAQTGGAVFTGHTELVCTDGTVPPEVLLSLLTQQGVSPSCKLMYASASMLREDAQAQVLTLRMAETQFLVPPTSLSRALEEWLGAGETALLPAPSKGLPEYVLVHRDGSMRRLSGTAAAGMRWLRADGGTVEVSSGKETLRLSSVRVQKRIEGAHLLYTVRIRADGSRTARNALAAQVQEECESAVQEMLAVGADVIGMEEVWTRSGRIPPQPADVHIEVNVEAG